MVIFSLASVPEREQALGVVVDCLLPQVDRLQVFLDRYSHVPSCLADPKIVVERGDRGDAGKFFWARESEGYLFFGDDDLLYPAGYVAHLKERVESYDRQAIVSLHGGVIAGPVKSYYRGGRNPYYRCLGTVANDVWVNVPGSGVSAYHSDTIEVGREDFSAEFRNMADIHFAIAAQRHKVPVVVAKHREGWLRHLDIDLNETIYAREWQHDPRQTALVNSYAPWTVYRVA